MSQDEYRDYRNNADDVNTQFIRMLHAETQRQLTKVTNTLEDVEDRLREIEKLKDYREGQVSISSGLGGVAFKIGLVILAFSLGVWGSSNGALPFDRPRSADVTTELHTPYPRKPLDEDLNNEQSD